MELLYGQQLTRDPVTNLILSGALWLVFACAMHAPRIVGSTRYNRFLIKYTIRVDTNSEESLYICRLLVYRNNRQTALLSKAPRGLTDYDCRTPSCCINIIVGCIRWVLRHSAPCNGTACTWYMQERPKIIQCHSIRYYFKQYRYQLPCFLK